MRVNVPLGGTTVELAPVINAEPKFPVNLYLSDGAGSATGKPFLECTPGLEEMAVSGDTLAASIHGHSIEYSGGTYIYSWSGNKVFEVDYNGSTFACTELLTASPSWDGWVTSADNGTYLMYVAVDRDGSFVESRVVEVGTTTVTDISATLTALGLGDPTTVTYLDGYFVVTTSNDKVLVSGINDPLSWSALDFGSVESDPDGIVAAAVYDNQLIVFGTSTYEIFQNIGGSGFPFQRIPGAIFDIGLYHPKLLAKGRNGLYFVGASEKDSLSVWVTRGAEPQRVSTNSLDQTIQELPPISGGVISGYGNNGLSYSAEGHYFAGFKFSGFNASCYLYDETTQAWHERRTLQTSTSGPWGPTFLCQIKGEIYALCNRGDYTSAPLAKVNKTEYQDFGSDIKREFVAPLPNNDMQPFRLPVVELTAEAIDSGSETMTMETSRNGRYWSGARSRSIPFFSGGNDNDRIVWRRNGRFPRYGYLRFIYDGDAYMRIYRLDIEVE